MGIIYGISTLLIFINYILVKKTDKKIDILKQLVYGIVVLFCYNAFICYVLTFFTIPITLLGLSIINLIISIPITVYMVKTKNIQKYKIEKVDAIYIVLLGIVVLIVSILNFGFPFRIKYATGDPSVHYLTSEKFAEEDSLMVGSETPDKVYGQLAARRFVSYVNSGLLMKCLNGVVDPLYNYEIFIGFGILTLFLTGWIFYSTVARFAKNNVLRFIIFVISIFFTVGYPLNSLLYGFEYLSIAILILGAIIDSVNTYQNEEIGFKQNLLVFFLLNFGLFNSYYMFVPYVYSALWIYFCITEYKRQKKLFTLKTAIMLLVTLLIPFFLGYIYCIATSMYRVIISRKLNGADVEVLNKFLNESEGTLKGLAAYGNIYVNIFSNLILLIPFSIYAVIKGLKQNKAVIMMTIFDVLFIEILLFGKLQGKVSSYYLSKNYFSLWLLMFYLTAIGIIISYEKHPSIPLISVAGYTVIVMLSVLFIRPTVSFGEADPTENALQVADVYAFNKDILVNSEVDLTREEIDIIKYARDNVPIDKTMEVLGRPEQVFWEYVMLRRIDNDTKKYSGQRLLEVKYIKAITKFGKVNYMIYFKNNTFYNVLEPYLFKYDNEIIFENNSGGIIKYLNVD